jgi:hypothetical protein
MPLNEMLCRGKLRRKTPAGLDMSSKAAKMRFQSPPKVWRMPLPFACHPGQNPYNRAIRGSRPGAERTVFSNFSLLAILI